MSDDDLVPASLEVMERNWALSQIVGKMRDEFTALQDNVHRCT